MIKVTCYLRVAKTYRGFSFAATGKPSTMPLNDNVTRQFKLVLSLPNNAFRTFDGEVAIDVPESALQPVIRAQVEAS